MRRWLPTKQRVPTPPLLKGARPASEGREEMKRGSVVALCPPLAPLPLTSLDARLSGCAQYVQLAVRLRSTAGGRGNGTQAKGSWIQTRQARSKGGSG